MPDSSYGRPHATVDHLSCTTLTLTDSSRRHPFYYYSAAFLPMFRCCPLSARFIRFHPFVSSIASCAVCRSGLQRRRHLYLFLHHLFTVIFRTSSTSIDRRELCNYLCYRSSRSRQPGCQCEWVTSVRAKCEDFQVHQACLT